MKYDLEKIKSNDIYKGSYYEIEPHHEPFNIHILKSGTVHPQMYLVIYEDALDEVSTEKLTAEQVKEKYGVDPE